MKKLTSLIIAIIMAFAIPCTAFASEPPKLTEEELMKQIADNKATVTHEVRLLSSYTQEEIEQSPDLQKLFYELHEAEPYTIHPASVDGKLYTTTVVTNAGDKVIYRSTPKVTFSVVDVGAAGSADIFSTFKLVETVNVNGDLDSGWHNAIRYKNITGMMGCGVNTAFTDDVTLSGNSSGVLSANIKGIIDFVVNVMDYTTLSKILAAFDTIEYNGGRESSRDITSANVRVVGAKMDKEELFSSEHNLTVQSSMSTIDSSKLTNQTAKAAAKWTFDVYYFVGSLYPEHSNEKITVNVDYLVNFR